MLSRFISFIIYVSEIISLLMFLNMLFNLALILNIVYRKIRYKDYFTTCDLNIFYLASKDGTKVSKDGTKVSKVALDILALFTFLRIFAYTPLVSIDILLLSPFIVYVAWSYWCLSVISNQRKVFPLFLNPFARYRFMKNYHALMKSVHRAVFGYSFCEDILNELSTELKEEYVFLSARKSASKKEYIEKTFDRILFNMACKGKINHETAKYIFTEFQNKQ